jgi:hypothetical protein
VPAVCHAEVGHDLGLVLLVAELAERCRRLLEEPDCPLVVAGVAESEREVGLRQLRVGGASWLAAPRSPAGAARRRLGLDRRRRVHLGQLRQDRRCSRQRRLRAEPNDRRHRFDRGDLLS